jgi:hypothetical protein
VSDTPPVTSPPGPLPSATVAAAVATAPSFTG